MPKPIHQRNFCISNGDPVETFMNYQIDGKGLENILILGEMEARVYIVINDGEVESLEYGDKFIGKYTTDEKDMDDLEKAKDIYMEVKKILNVDEELKKYNFQPKEPDLFGYLGVDDASQIRSFFLE